MAQVTATRREARRSPIEYVVDRVWRFFCSVRAAVYEIAIATETSASMKTNGNERKTS